MVASDYEREGSCAEYAAICQKEGISLQEATYCVSSEPEDVDIISVIENYETMKKIIREFSPDILHSVQLNPTVELISRELAIPHIMNIYPVKGDFFFRQYDYMDIFPHYHVCDSRYYAKRWKRYLHTDSVCIRTVVNDSMCFAREGFTKTQVLKFICVGSIYDMKNQLAVIQGFHKALLNGVSGTLSLYGSAVTDYAKTCEKYIVENGLESFVEIKGFCSNMGEIYRQSDVLICASRRESYPNAVSEAMANGCIVISAPVGGVPEVIHDGENGYLCGGFEAEDIYSGIMRLAKDRENGNADTLLGKANQTFRTEHSSRVITEKLLEYYTGVTEDFAARRHSSIRLNHVVRAFGRLIDLYHKNTGRFSEPEAVKRKLWYLYYLENMVERMRKDAEACFYIWGTGRYGQTALEIIDVFFPEMKISGFIDTYKQGRFMQYEIFQPEKILDSRKNIIFVALYRGQNDVLGVLEQYGRTCNGDYFVLARRYW